METSPEQQQLAKAKLGDKDAWEFLFSRYWKKVFGFAMQFLGREDEALNVTQSSFLTAFQKIQTLKDGVSFPTWLLSIAHNHCRNTGRRLTWKRSEMDACEISSGAESPLTASIRAEENLRLIRALDALEPEDRAILKLHYHDNIRYEDIAVILGIALNTVKSRLFRAREKLREHLGLDAGEV